MNGIGNAFDDKRICASLKHFCAVVAEPFESKSNRLHIRFYANRATVNSSFTIYYSTFRKKMRGTCEPHELDCEDDTCIISEGLKCNKRPNCKFQKDEEDCPPVTFRHFRCSNRFTFTLKTCSFALHLFIRSFRFRSRRWTKRRKTIYCLS